MLREIVVLPWPHVSFILANVCRDYTPTKESAIYTLSIYAHKRSLLLNNTTPPSKDIELISKIAELSPVMNFNEMSKHLEQSYKNASEASLRYLHRKYLENAEP